MRYFLLSIFLLLPAAGLAIEDSEETININSVTILAATSMSVPVTEIAKLYSRASGVDVNTVYEDATELHNQIMEGEPADIIVMQSKSLLDKMRVEGQIDGNSIKIIGANSLHVVAAKEMVLDKNPDAKNVLKQIYNKSLIVIADPATTPLGQSTKESLQRLKLWNQFEKRVVLAPTSSKTIDLIIKGQSAGIVYASDAKLYADKINDFGPVPASAYTPIAYYAALVVGENMDLARPGLKFFDSAGAKKVLKDHGFAQQ